MSRAKYIYCVFVAVTASLLTLYTIVSNNWAVFGHPRTFISETLDPSSSPVLTEEDQPFFPPFTGDVFPPFTRDVFTGDHTATLASDVPSVTESPVFTIFAGSTAALTNNTLLHTADMDREYSDEYLQQPDPSVIKNSTDSKISSHSTAKSEPSYFLTAPPVTNIRRKSLVIMAQARTGSSFLGDIFNHDNDFMYVFEPFHAVKGGTVDMQSKFYLDFFHCKFNGNFFGQYLQNFQKWPTSLSKSKALWKKPSLCNGKGRSTLTGICRGGYDVMKVEQKCESYQNLATKVIRTHNISSLIPLLNDKSLDGRVIHLVRDPRPTVSSRAHFKLNVFGSLSGFTGLAATACAELRKQIQSILHEYPPLSSDPSRPYIIIRYEELTSDPVKYATMLYQWMGLNIPAEVVRWLNDATSSNLLKNPFYGTKRNSKVMATRWRHELPFDRVQIVENACSDVMKLLGYQQVGSMKNLQNNDYQLFLDKYDLSYLSLSSATL